jgi:hypothetical protein
MQREQDLDSRILRVRNLRNVMVPAVCEGKKQAKHNGGSIGGFHHARRYCAKDHSADHSPQDCSQK